MSKWILNIAVVISAGIAIWASEQSSNLYTYFKPLTTVLVLLFPLVFGVQKTKSYDRYILVGLVFSLIGDIMLLDNSRFLFGLVSFLIAHIIFIFAFLQIGGFKKNISVLIGLLAYGGVFYGYLFSGLGGMAIPVLGYVAVILLMAWQGISLYLKYETRHALYVMIGVILFMISDSILAINKFKEPIPLSSLWILTTYWGAILLLANSTSGIKKTHTHFEKITDQ